MTIETFIKISDPKEISKMTGISISCIRTWKQQIRKGQELGMTYKSQVKLLKGAKLAGIEIG